MADTSTSLIVRPLQLSAPNSVPQPSETAQTSPPDPVAAEWVDILSGEQASRLFAEGGEKMYLGYIIGRLAASQSPDLRQHASLPSMPPSPAAKPQPARAQEQVRPQQPPSGKAPASGSQAQKSPQPPVPPPSRPSPAASHAGQRVPPSPTPSGAPSPPRQPSPNVPPARRATPDAAAVNAEHARTLLALNAARDQYARIVARQRMSHNAALLEHSRSNTTRQRLIRYLGYLMVPTDAMDLRQARTNETEANQAATTYNEALNNYIQAIGGDRAQRDTTRLRMMNEFESRVQQYALQSMEPPRPAQQASAPAQGAAPNPPQAPAPSRQYRPSRLARRWVESGPGGRAAMVALTAGAAAVVLSTGLVVVSAPWWVTWGVGAVTPFVARSLGARFATRMNRHRYVYPSVATAHEQQAQARNRSYLQSTSADERQVDVTTAYREGTRQYSGEALTEKRRAEKAAGIAAAIGFFATQLAANAIKYVSEYGLFGTSPPKVVPPEHIPTPNATPTPTPTPSGVNYNGWPWDVAKQLGSPDPLQTVQNAINHLNAGGGHYSLIQQPNGKEWVEQLVNGHWAPLSPSQQFGFNQYMAGLPVS